MTKQIKPIDPEYVYIDLFCGAGGTTLGITLAKAKDIKELYERLLAIVIACVNHDPKAIKSHWANHPEVKHFEEDILLLDLTELIALVNKYRKLYPNAKIVLWASLECTNFSKAKGGQPRDADSRTLAWGLIRYIEALNPDYVQIENVVEFMSWGPLDDNGKPVSRKNGSDWMKWREFICSQFGYRDEWRELNSANYGAYTSRNRLFGIFAKEGLPIAFPKPTHAKKPSKSSMFGDLKKWKAVKDVLDFQDEGKSIFNRDTPLVDASLERIYAGLLKFVAGGKDNFLIKYNSMNQSGKYVPPDSDEPCPTISCQCRLGLAKVAFIQKNYSGAPEGKVHSVEEPAGAVTTIDHHSVVNACFLQMRYGGSPEGKTIGVNQPARTITTTDHHHLVQPTFLAKYHGNGENIHSVEEPASTISTKDRLAKVECFLTKYNSGRPENKIQTIEEPSATLTTSDRMCRINCTFLETQYGSGQKVASVNQPCGTILNTPKQRVVNVEYSENKNWLDKQYSGADNHQSVDQPAGAILANDKHCLMSCKPFIVNTNYNNESKSIEEPCATIVASRRHMYLLNPSPGGHTQTVDNPCPVIVARQDKAPLYLINAIEGYYQIPVYQDDSDVMTRIKVFMSLYGIVDIKMRMLKVPELLKIQGFPENYVLHGSQSDQKKFIGNSVVPLVVARWIEELYEASKKLTQ